MFTLEGEELNRYAFTPKGEERNKSHFEPKLTYLITRGVYDGCKRFSVEASMMRRNRKEREEDNDKSEDAKYRAAITKRQHIFSLAVITKRATQEQGIRCSVPHVAKRIWSHCTKGWEEPLDTEG